MKTAFKRFFITLLAGGEKIETELKYIVKYSKTVAILQKEDNKYIKLVICKRATYSYESSAKEHIKLMRYRYKCKRDLPKFFKELIIHVEYK